MHVINLYICKVLRELGIILIALSFCSSIARAQNCDGDMPSDLIVPNIVTPNGDDLNDFFKVYSEELFTVEVNIYNRWGERLHTYTGINGEWDMTIHGKPVSDGVYFYSITFTSTCSTEKKVKNGSFTVVK